MRKKICLTLGCTLALGIASAAWAKLTPDELARLGKDLTPVGAEKAGNKEGTIPAWDGGITKPPAGWKPGTHLIDPFPDEKPLFTITAANMAQYADKLPEGYKALLKAYPTYKMHVYPSHRTAAMPKWMYDATIKAAATAELLPGNGGLTGSVHGYPFPIPKNGLEALWNPIIRCWGTGWKDRISAVAAVTRSGDFQITRALDSASIHYWDPKTTEATLNNLNWLWKQLILSPPYLAGRVVLLQEMINQGSEARRAWIYNPGQRRVRRAPEYAFDNPWEGSDGLMTIDSVDVFNGSPERYNWKLVGKKEMYIGYNAYRVISPKLKYKDVLKPLHPNPELMRYELHRVWVVDGTLKPGQRHIYKRKTIYIDEDSWMAMVGDEYDHRDQLWRVSEMHSVNYYDVPINGYGPEFHYDLQAGRYAANWLRNEEPPWNISLSVPESEFTIDAIRTFGTR